MNYFTIEFVADIASIVSVPLLLVFYLQVQKSNQSGEKNKMASQNISGNENKQSISQ